MNHRFFLLLICAALLAALSDCAPGGPAPAPAASATAIPPTPTARPTFTPEPEASPTPEPQAGPTLLPTAAAPENPAPAAVVYGPRDFPANVSPLTGLTAADPALLERRPLAVKVQMFPRGQRPPWGISQADLVFDYYQNFGLTRLHAIFYSQDVEQVGPVRSARLLDVELVKMYKTIFAFGSAEQRTYSKLFNQAFADRLVVEGNANCPPLCRVEPDSYNYLLANTAELGRYVAGKGVDNSRQDLRGMSFNSAAPDGGMPVGQLFTRFSISSYNYWNYDSASGRYLRFQDVQEAMDSASEAFEPLVDRANGQQIAADNVVVLIVPHQYVFNTHPGPSEVVEILLSGSGPGIALRNGLAYQVNWNRPSADAVVSLTFPDGTPFPLQPGVTWFEVLGKTSKIDSSVPGILRIIHAIP